MATVHPRPGFRVYTQNPIHSLSHNIEYSVQLVADSVREKLLGRSPSSLHRVIAG